GSHRPAAGRGGEAGGAERGNHRPLRDPLCRRASQGRRPGRGARPPQGLRRADRAGGRFLRQARQAAGGRRCGRAGRNHRAGEGRAQGRVGGRERLSHGYLPLPCGERAGVKSGRSAIFPRRGCSKAPLPNPSSSLLKAGPSIALPRVRMRERGVGLQGTPMRLHILGICGTFMGGVAALARELGLEVEGSDANVYPPMSTQLEALGIRLMDGYAAEHLESAPDLVVVGNAMTRGNPAVKYMLDAQLRYVSGPEWLGETVLAGRGVLAVAGTHGKTTTSSLLAHLLESAGMAPGFLIGGVPGNFGVSARLGENRGQSRLSEMFGANQRPQKTDSDPGFLSPFVIEADEYDTAFFDKRSKFVHYRPRIAILNNLEYDHADIFPDVAAIQRQFHHLVRTVPGNGRLIVNAHDERL